ncbi:MAG TPA: S9 family peptidase [Gammaproteobacteria bacterium]|nr:S9 family peptidase [Gammaproteobacteria bacterium]
MAVAADSQPPVEDFFRNARYSQMTLSPDGRYLAALAPSEGRRNIALIDLVDRSKSRFLTRVDKDIAGYFWASNDRLVFTLDNDGNESFGLYAIGLDGRPIRTLIEPGTGLTSVRTATVLDDLRDEDDYILIAYNKRDLRYQDVYRLNIKNGALDMVARNPGDVATWVPDHKGRIRAAVAQKELVTEIRYRKDEDSDWQVIASFQFPEPTWFPIGFDYDDRTLLVASQIQDDTSDIYRFDPETKTWGERVFGRDDVDVSGLIWSDHRSKIIGAAYYVDKPYRTYFDEDEAALMASIEAAFPGEEVTVTSVTRDESKRIVIVWSDREPGRYYLFDRTSGKLEFLAKVADWIDPAQMSPMKYVSFKSRDGLTLYGYLTVPKNSNGKNLPLIVNPHGGPYGVRDQWGFNPEHQFLASRGYAVLQVNFRGSGGYGYKFLTAGFKQWGRKMQDDITDAVQWAISEGIADPKRICIYGGSYGGYATMAGLVFTPELYQCGVNYVGVTDVPLLFETMPRLWELQRAQLAVMVGDPEKERAFLDDISPINHVANIRAPVFIVHGDLDPRVNIKHAEKLRMRLEELGKPYEWLVKYNEGHGFRKEENRIELYKKMETFFAKYLGQAASQDAVAGS